MEGALAHCEAEHLVLGDQRVTFEQLIDQVAAVAASLREDYGVEAGDRTGRKSVNVHQASHAT